MKAGSTQEPKNICPKGYFRLIPAIFVLSLVAVVAAIYLGISSRGTRKETRRLHAEIARLGSGLGQQVELLRHAEPLSGSPDEQSRSGSATQDSLKTLADLRKRVAAEGSDTDSLRHKVEGTQNRLRLLESEGKIAETVIRDYGSGVCLLHIVVEFLDKESGRPLRVAADATGNPPVDGKGKVQLDAGGTGPSSSD